MSITSNACYNWREFRPRRYTEYGDNADNGNREIINANVSSMAYANAEYMLSQHCTVDSSGNFVGTYWGVSYAGLEAEDHQSDNNSQVETQRLQAEHDARMADQENTMNAISQGAQSAATAFSGRAPSVVTPAASSTAAYNSPNAGQAAIQACSQNNAYLHWQGLCQTANAGNNQGPCYCAAAALLRVTYRLPQTILMLAIGSKTISRISKMLRLLG